MFAFSRNNDKLREEIILIGFQVRPKGRTGYNSSNIQNLEVFYIQICKNDPWKPSCLGIG